MLRCSQLVLALRYEEIHNSHYIIVCPVNSHLWYITQMTISRSRFVGVIYLFSSSPWNSHLCCRLPLGHRAHFPWVLFTFTENAEALRTSVGYAGGTLANPDYRTVCSGTTGHAEVLRIEFDPAIVSYGELVGESIHHFSSVIMNPHWRARVEFCYRTHDPTTVDRQGADIGYIVRPSSLTSLPRRTRLSRSRPKCRREQAFRGQMEDDCHSDRGRWGMKLRNIINFIYLSTQMDISAKRIDCIGN